MTPSVCANCVEEPTGDRWPLRKTLWRGREVYLCRRCRPLRVRGAYLPAVQHTESLSFTSRGRPPNLAEIESRADGQFQRAGRRRS